MPITPITLSRLWLQKDDASWLALPYLLLCRLEVAQAPMALAAIRSDAGAGLMENAGRRSIALVLEGMASDGEGDAIWQEDAANGRLRRYRWQLGEASAQEALFQLSRLSRSADKDDAALRYRLELTASGNAELAA